MKINEKDLPQVVTREEWVTERKKLLEKEKEHTKQRDQLNADRRRLPMVKIDKNYEFEGPDGKVSLLDLFEDYQQLITYHFMFDPKWEAGCTGCSFLVDNIGHLSHLYARNTNLVLVSRAPLPKLEAYKKRMGWTVPWYSSYGSDFNYNFHVTIDQEKGSTEYNYQEVSKLGESWKGWSGEVSGISIFLRKGKEIYHTYSAFFRGTELLDGTLMYLDLTPFGRQEYWENPEGRANAKASSWWKRHDEYDK